MKIERDVGKGKRVAGSSLHSALGSVCFTLAASPDDGTEVVYTAGVGYEFVPAMCRIVVA